MIQNRALNFIKKKTCFFSSLASSNVVITRYDYSIDHIANQATLIGGEGGGKVTKIRGVARIFQRGEGLSQCVSSRVLTRLSCRHPRCVLQKVTFFSDEQYARGRVKPTK